MPEAIFNSINMGKLSQRTPSFSTLDASGAGKETGFGLPSPGNSPVTRNSMRDPGISVAQGLAPRKQGHVSETFQMPVQLLQPLASHQDVHVLGKPTKAMGK